MVLNLCRILESPLNEWASGYSLNGISLGNVKDSCLFGVFLFLAGILIRAGDQGHYLDAMLSLSDLLTFSSPGVISEDIHSGLDVGDSLVFKAFKDGGIVRY